MLWQEPFPLLTLAAITPRIKLGLNVTNPGTREPTVPASAFATLQDISGGRMVWGSAGGTRRGASSARSPCVKEFEAAA